MDWLSEACLLIDEGRARSGVDLLPKLSGQQAFSKCMGKGPSVRAAGTATGACLGPHTATDPAPRVIGGGLIVWSLSVSVILSHFS